MFEELSTQLPGVVDYSESLVMSQGTLAQTLDALGSSAEAQAVAEAAIVFCRKLVEMHPKNPLVQSRLIGTYAVLGRVNSSSGRYDDALEALTTAAGLLRKLIEAHPDSTEYRNEAWRNALGRADVQLARGCPDEAADAVEALVGQPSRQIDICYDAACMYAKAAAMASKLPHRPVTDPRSKRYEDRAMDLLRRAIALGFDDAKHLGADTDLDGLRARPDFQALIMDLAMPADPFAPKV
jgi:tetratricopeptide (TPR) repeat protein